MSFRDLKFLVPLAAVLAGALLVFDRVVFHAIEMDVVSLTLLAMTLVFGAAAFSSRWRFRFRWVALIVAVLSGVVLLCLAVLCVANWPMREDKPELWLKGPEIDAEEQVAWRVLLPNDPAILASMERAVPHADLLSGEYGEEATRELARVEPVVEAFWDSMASSSHSPELATEYESGDRLPHLIELRHCVQVEVASIMVLAEEDLENAVERSTRLVRAIRRGLNGEQSLIGLMVLAACGDLAGQALFKCIIKTEEGAPESALLELMEISKSFSHIPLKGFESELVFFETELWKASTTRTGAWPFFSAYETLELFQMRFSRISQASSLSEMQQIGEEPVRFGLRNPAGIQLAPIGGAMWRAAGRTSIYEARSLAWLQMLGVRVDQVNPVTGLPFPEETEGRIDLLEGVDAETRLNLEKGYWSDIFIVKREG